MEQNKVTYFGNLLRLCSSLDENPSSWERQQTSIISEEFFVHLGEQQIAMHGNKLKFWTPNLAQE